MTFEDTISKSQQLDRALARPLGEGAMAQEIGGKRLVGDLGGIFGQMRKAVEEARLGVAGAASELMTEVQGLKNVEKAIRSETATVREFTASVLGNAVGGEGLEETPVKPPPTHEGEQG